MEKITEITSKVGNGVTSPYYAKIDSLSIVVKSIKNDDVFYALFNEAIGYFLAEILNFPHPEFGFAKYHDGYTKNFIENDVSFEDKEVFTYTVLENSVLPIDAPGMLDTIDKKDIIQLIIFDAFISNTDRNKGNLLIKMPKKGSKAKLFPLDYTHIFPGECLWFEVLKNGNPSVQKMVEQIFDTGNYQMLIENKKFERCEVLKISREFQSRIDDIDIDGIIDSIPSEIKNGHNDKDLTLLKSFIERNKNEFDDIIEEILRHLVR